MKFYCKKSFERHIAATITVTMRGSRTCVAFLLSLLLTNGCSWLDNSINAPERLSERDPRVQQMPEQKETVRGEKDPPLVKLELGRALRPVNLRPSEELPSKIKIEATNLNNVPVTTALQAVLADTDITLLWESQGLQDRKVTLMNLKGSLPTVVNRICRAAKILCAYRNGALELAQEDTFVVQLPGVATSSGASGSDAASATIAASIESLINGKVKADTVGGNLIYTTNAEGHERIQGYLDQLRNGRPLIVMQLYIWQVTLDDNKKLGISWRDLHLPSLGGTGQSLNIISNSLTQTVANTEGISLGAVLSGSVDVNLLAGFLATQGKVQAISSPQLTFVSGTSAKFEVGNKEKYVAQVGTSTSTVGGTGSTTGSAQNTVTTEELKTGLEISISGNYESGVVFSNLKIKTSDLVQFTNIPTGTTTLQLPRTADRTVETVLRVRPGDNLVLAGLQTSREDRTREGLPGPEFMDGVIPNYGDRKISNSELVLMVKPSIVFFSDKEGIETRGAASVSEPMDKLDEQNAAATIEKATIEKAPVYSRPANSLPTQNNPNELQSEFGSVVKSYEDTYIPPVNTPVTTPAHNNPQSILPDDGTVPDRKSKDNIGATL